MFLAAFYFILRTHESLHAALRAAHSADISVTSLQVQRWGVGPKTENFAKISAYKRPVGAYPLGDFYQIFIICRQLGQVIKFGLIRSKVSEFWGFKFRSVQGTRNFQCPLQRNYASDVNTFWRCKNGMDHFYYGAKFSGGRTERAAGGEKVQCFFFKIYLFSY